MCITQERVSEGRAETVCVLEYKKHTGWLSRGCITAHLFPHPLLLCQLYEVCVCVRIRNQPWLGFTTHIIRKCAKLCWLSGFHHQDSGKSAARLLFQKTAGSKKWVSILRTHAVKASSSSHFTNKACISPIPFATRETPSLIPQSSLSPAAQPTPPSRLPYSHSNSAHFEKAFGLSRRAACSC